MGMQRRILCQACQRVLDGYTNVDTGPCQCELPVIRREDVEWLIRQVLALQDVDEALRVARREKKRGW